jgi:hypothetical protein
MSTQPEMDDWFTEVWMREFVYQAEIAVLAAGDLNQAIAYPAEGSVTRAFMAVQSLLGAGAMVSKMLWPQPPKMNLDGTSLTGLQESERQVTVGRGKYLRRVLQVREIPILESRRVRNAVEHFDTRLDEHFKGGNRFIIDRNIGPRGDFIVIDDEPPLHLRLIDPMRWTVSVLEDEVSMQELLNAITDVASRAQAWLTTHGLPRRI